MPQALPVADRLLLTELDLEAKGDALFPAFSPQVARGVPRFNAFPRGEKDDAASFEVVTCRTALILGLRASCPSLETGTFPDAYSGRTGKIPVHAVISGTKCL